MFQNVFGQFVSRITHTWCHICSCVECPCCRWKQECQSIINELNFNFFANVPQHETICLDPCNIKYNTCWVIFLSFELPEPHLGQDSMVRQDNNSFMEFQLLRTMDQVLQLDLGLYFCNAMLVTTFWSCFVPLGRHWFDSQSLLWLPVLVPSHPAPATFCPCWTHSLVLIWFPWNCRINGACCLDPTPLQITTMCALHSVYNDKVSEIGKVPKLLDRLLDCQYTPFGHTNLPWWFKQDNLCRAKLLDNFLDNSLLKLWLSGMAWRQLEVDMKVT